MRRGASDRYEQLDRVSIHAPWEGCDEDITIPQIRALGFQFTHPGKGATSTYQRGRCPACCFNSRTLGRVRPTRPRSPPDLDRFQFTHPGKGATLTSGQTLFFFRSFNSRTLGRVRLKITPLALFSISVSIHAPWEGCDERLKVFASLATCFNSRTLGRVRLFVLVEVADARPVSIHAPWEGCDYTQLFKAGVLAGFQFTHPGKGATHGMHIDNLINEVSIHAPWEGCDALGRSPRPCGAGFNSRTLGRVRRMMRAPGRVRS